ncbi:MAG: alpha/beta hydrolase [Bacteroidetes bacterium]|nr:alpha/beta hydrolase [Bacteroidota bacterium]
MPAIKIQKKNINVTDEGTGKIIVLLHGFTESLKIWTSFSLQLSKKYRVITIDLPGHGKSDSIDKIHSMELMADVVHEVLKKLKVGKCLMVGHSMGGYVTLAFAAKYPGMLKGFSLFHSHCFADTATEQENRNRTITIVGQDKFSYVAQFIPSLFPVEVHKKFSKQIERMIQRASKMEKEGVIAALEGMKIRKDQSDLLKKTLLPVLFILGQKDSKAPHARLWEMIALPAVSETLLLRECGHMGYIEAPNETLNALAGFARKCL